MKTPSGQGAPTAVRSDAARAILEALRSAGSHPIVRGFPHGAIVVFDHDLRYLAAGGLGLPDVGLNAVALEGHTIFDVLPADVIASIEPLYRAALAGRESVRDIVHGDRIYVQRLAPLAGPDGVILAAMGFTQDVTEERQNALALQLHQDGLSEQHSRLREAQAIGRVGSWDLDLRTDVITWSETLFELFGVDPLSFSGDVAGSLECMHPDDRDRVRAAVETCIRTGEPLDIRYRIVRPVDGVTRWFDSRGTTVREHGRRVRVIGSVVDMTDQVDAEETARAAGSFFDAVLSASPDHTVVMELATGAVVYGSRYQDVLGLTSDQLQTMGPAAVAALIHPSDRLRVRAADVAAGDLEDGRVVQIRYRARHTDGQWHWLNRRVTPFTRDAAGSVVQVLGVVRDVTDMMEAEDRRTHAALHDELTGLPNRALLIDRLTAALVRSNRREREVAVLFCDLDGFKRVNETGGHAAGDAVLRETARRLQNVLRDGDTVARVGGDEFVITVEAWNRSRPGGAAGASEPPLEQDRLLALQFAERVAASLREPFVVDDIEHVVTASTGIAYAKLSVAGRAGTVTADEVLADANAAMYQAKARGKDCFEVFRDSLRADLAERGRTEQVLRQALRDERGPGSPALNAAYQPVFDAGSGSLIGFEALARLTDGAGLAIAPDVFIAVAEGAGLIRPLGLLMLDLACGQLATWRSELAGMPGITMAVNVSALQAQSASLGGDVHRALDAHGLAPSDLVLELTETAMLQAADSTITTLRALHDEGIAIAIDDFGTGYASLRYLATLPVSALKVDKSFTAGLTTDEPSRKIVKAVAGLAADLGLDCIVEGVETPGQRAALPAGVKLQGWLTGRPERADLLDLPQLLRAGAPA